MSPEPGAPSSPDEDNSFADFFEVRVDLEQRCLFMTMRGVWNDAAFDAFTEALRNAEDRMRALAGITYALVDGTDFPVQPVDIAARFPVMVGILGIPQNRRTALVAPEMVHRAQARESGDLVNARYFRTAESARDWLFSDEA